MLDLIKSLREEITPLQRDASEGSSASNTSKSSGNSSGDAAEAVNKELQVRCGMSYEQRFWGFVICISVGLFFDLLASLVFWKGRDLQMEWMTNAAIEVWMSYKMPAASLELASTLIKSNPKLQPYLQSAALADPEHMEKTAPVMRKYALRAEAYVWQCWSALNTAEYMIALSAAGTDQAAYTKFLTSSAATT